MKYQKEWENLVMEIQNEKPRGGIIMQTWTIIKEFTGGTLDGLVISEKSYIKWQVGAKIANPSGGSPFKIISCTPNQLS